MLELEEADASVEEGLDALTPRLRAFVQRLRVARSIEELCDIVAEDIRHITGFDRALVYRFDRDWHGTVLAENGNGVLPSYLDLRFPASDIPARRVNSTAATACASSRMPDTRRSRSRRP